MTRPACRHGELRGGRHWATTEGRSYAMTGREFPEKRGERQAGEHLRDGFLATPGMTKLRWLRRVWPVGWLGLTRFGEIPVGRLDDATEPVVAARGFDPPRFGRTLGEAGLAVRKGLANRDCVFGKRGAGQQRGGGTADTEPGGAANEGAARKLTPLEPAENVFERIGRLANHGAVFLLGQVLPAGNVETRDGNAGSFTPDARSIANAGWWAPDRAYHG